MREAEASFTFFVQYIDGTGFPEALHSKVTAPPFRAVICPLDGTARTLGGTENLISKLFSLARLKINKSARRTTQNRVKKCSKPLLA
jgi:hypothetical protein